MKMFKPPLRISRPLGDITNTVSCGPDSSEAEQKSSSPPELQPRFHSISKRVTPSPFIPPCIKPSSLEHHGQVKFGPHVDVDVGPAGACNVEKIEVAKPVIAPVVAKPVISTVTAKRESDGDLGGRIERKKVKSYMEESKLSEAEAKTAEEEKRLESENEDRRKEADLLADREKAAYSLHAQVQLNIQSHEIEQGEFDGLVDSEYLHMEHLQPEVVEKASFEERINKIASEILVDLTRKSKKMERGKKSSVEDVKKTIKKLTFQEKCNKNNKLFNLHIKEDRLESKETLYSCKTCPKFVKTINKVKATKHASSHGLPRKRKRERSVVFECSFCNTKSLSKADYVKHYQETHCESLSNLTCTKCFKDFGNMPALSEHLRLCHVKAARVKEICPDCGKGFLTRRFLLRHIKTVHNNLKRNNCHICDKSFRDSYGLKRHMTMKHRDSAETSPLVSSRDIVKTTPACPLCNKKVKKLNKHLRISHSVDKNLNPFFKESKFQCKDCGKPCRDRWDLVRHGRTCPPKSNEAATCDSCDKVFSSQTNLKRHMKEIHQNTRICDKCKQNFADKNKFYDHLPCKCLCQCGKSFPTLWRFHRHKKSCNGMRPNAGSPVQASSSEYQNVISYQCFICKIKDIKVDDVKNHIDEFHEPRTEAEVIRCDSCDSLVLDVYEHICAKHVSIRRFRRSYIESTLRPHTVFAKKSSQTTVAIESALDALVESIPVDVVRSEGGIALPDDEPEGIALYDGTEGIALPNDDEEGNTLPEGEAEVIVLPAGEAEGIVIPEVETESIVIPEGEAEGIVLPEGEAEGIVLPEGEAEGIVLPEGEAEGIVIPEVETEGIVLTEGEAEGIVLPEGEAEGIVLPEGEAEGIVLTEGEEEGIVLPEGETEGIVLTEGEAEGIALTEVEAGSIVLEDEEKGITLREDKSDDMFEKSSVFGFDKDLEALLGKESEERANQNLKLDLIDKEIEEEGKAAVLLHKLIDKRMKDFQCTIKKGEEDRSVSKSRAELVMKLSVEEIKYEAENSLAYIGEIEDGEKESFRKLLFFKSAGHRQSLLYKQIWEPFTEEQFEAALKVLTTWHNARDDKDEQYILNVSLPDLFIHMYQRIFDISSLAESEASIFNTPEE